MGPQAADLHHELRRCQGRATALRLLLNAMGPIPSMSDVESFDLYRQGLKSILTDLHLSVNKAEEMVFALHGGHAPPSDSAA